MNLQEELSKLAQDFQQQAPPEAQNAFLGLVTGLKKSDIVHQGPKVGESITDFSLRNIYKDTSVGDRIKDFSLPNPWGEVISLSEVLKEGPVVLNFYKGNWCPYCNVELRALQLALPRFRKLGANLVAISLEKPDETLKTLNQHDLSFIVLSDVDGRVAKQFKIIYEAPKFSGMMRDLFQTDIAAHNGSDIARSIIPATYVIDTDFTVRFAFLDEDFTRRADIEEIIAALGDIRDDRTTPAAAS